MFFCKTYEDEKDFLVAICDKNLLGEELPFKEIIFKVEESFYGNKLHNENQIKNIMRKATVINAVGNNIVDLLLKEGFIEENKIIKIGDTLHAQMAKI